MRLNFSKHYKQLLKIKCVSASAIYRPNFSGFFTKEVKNETCLSKPTSVNKSVVAIDTLLDIQNLNFSSFT